MKITKGASAAYSGVKAKDDLIYSLRENEVLTVKSIHLFILDATEVSNIELWVGPSYTGAVSLGTLTARNVMGAQTLEINPNVCFRNQEKMVVTVALGDAGAACEYTIVYQVETVDTPGYDVPVIQPCNLFDRLTGRC